MLRVTEIEKTNRLWWLPILLGSFVVHGTLFHTASDIAQRQPREHYAPSRVEFRAPPPPPPVEPPPPPPVAEPEPEPEPKIARPHRPKPNRAEPAPEPTPEPPKPVFGVTADSLADGASGVAVRVGNTLEKEMEREVTAPNKIAALPAAPDKPAPAPKKPEPVRPVPTYALSQAPTFKKKVEPAYPDNARLEGVEGTVQLEVLIDENGRVRKVKVLKTPGHGLERAAISALSQSVFNPGLANGVAVPVKIKIPYRFVLDA